MSKMIGKRENPVKEKKRPIRRMMRGPFPPDEKYDKLRQLWAILVLVVGVFCVEVISLFLTARHIPGLFVTFFANPMVILINLAPLALLAVFVYVLTGFSWLGVILPGILLTILTFINIFKILLRGDPFVFSDIFMAAEAGDIMQYYSIVFSKSQIACSIALIVGFVLCVLLTGRIRLKGHWILRLVIAAVCAAGFAAMLLFVYPKNSLYKAFYAGREIVSTRSDDQWYSAHGFTWSFLHSATEEQVKVVEWDPETDTLIQQEMEESGVEGIPADKQVNVIMVQLEAYCDLSEYIDSDEVEDAYKYFHEIQAESVHGHLLDNVNGGGTIDTERSVMTGYSYLPDFTEEPYNSYIWYLRSYGYTVEGSHPGNQWFYDRNIVNTYLGFQNYWFSENMYESLVDVNEAPYESDDVLFTQLIDLMEQSTTPYFSLNISYQNHGPYRSESLRYGAEERITAEECSNKTSRNIVNNYLYQVSLTDQALKKMTDTLNASDEPVVVVMFGDHKPYLGDYTDLDTWQELGINDDVSTDEGFYNFYSTPYFIWANDAAKEVLGDTYCPGDGGDFGSCFLMNKVFEVCGWGGDIMMRASNELLDAGITMVHSAVDAYYENGVLTDTLSDAGRQALSRFLSIQEYWMNHFQYEDLWDGKIVKAATSAQEEAEDAGLIAKTSPKPEAVEQPAETAAAAADTGGQTENTVGTAVNSEPAVTETTAPAETAGPAETSAPATEPEPAAEPAAPDPEPEPQTEEDGTTETTE